MSDSEHSIPLSDVTLERARQENNTIDEQFRDLESQLSTVEQKKESLAEEKASLEDELESVRDERDALEQVVATYKDERKSEMLDSIRSTIEAAAVDADDLDVDFSELEEADLSTLKTTKQMVETTIEAAGLDTERVSNRGESPDLSGVEGDDGDDWEKAAQAAADDLGIGDDWQKLQSGERLADGPQAIGTGGDDSRDDAVQELAELVSEVSNR